MFSFTYFGYAAILVEFEKHILFDPGILNKAPLVDIDQVKASYVLVSHDPVEHFGNAVEFANIKGSILVGNSSVCNTAKKLGVYSYALTEISLHKPLEIGANIQITGYNLPRGGFLAPQNTAFLAETQQGSVLHLGHPKSVGELEDLKPDLLCIPVAGKKRGTFSPEAAVIATIAIHPRYALPISGSDTQTQQFLTSLKNKKQDIIPISLSPGQSFTLV
jgi:L-ascorbate metabolism protein UlaG (beta-lactamase superfamily)